METPIDRRRRSRNMKSNICMPRLRGSTRKSTRILSPMSLLERFRVAVFRLIMLQSALSKPKGTAHENRTSSSSSSVHQYHQSYYSYDSHQSEAVADCIEFIKKTSTIDDEVRESNGTSSAVDNGALSEVVLPLPVM